MIELLLLFWPQLLIIAAFAMYRYTRNISPGRILIETLILAAVILIGSYRFIASIMNNVNF